ncbi:MAG: DUF3833 domain-containing protein [Alphaproteobacteria bacterium]|nr:DUF3833 domain-containing protein [Alphaproteobacteria bacterium]
MRILKGFLLMGLMTFLSSCSGATLDHYKGAEPPLTLEQYFTGPIKAWGIVQDRSGKVTRRFDVNLVGSWDGNVGTLDEDFTYYDGEKQKRVWTIKSLDNGKYEGTAGDIIGTADGQIQGNTMRWAYQMDLPVGDKTYNVTFDDWMFLMNDGVLVNRSYIKKFGVTVAELTLFMQKQDQ